MPIKKKRKSLGSKIKSKVRKIALKRDVKKATSRRTTKKYSTKKQIAKTTKRVAKAKKAGANVTYAVPKEQSLNPFVQAKDIFAPTVKKGRIRKKAKSVLITKGGAYAAYGTKTKAARSFRSAFRKAKDEGKKTFNWDGRSYTTKTKAAPKKATAKKTTKKRTKTELLEQLGIIKKVNPKRAAAKPRRAAAVKAKARRTVAIKAKAKARADTRAKAKARRADTRAKAKARRTAVKAKAKARRKKNTGVNY